MIGPSSDRALRFRAAWSPRLAVLLVLLVAVALGIRLWAPLLGTALRVSDPPQPADAIVMTYAAMTEPGVDETLRLYRDGWAPIVVLSDFEMDNLAGRLGPFGRRALLARGVPESALIDLEPTPTSEFEEAAALRRLFDQRGWRSALVVSTEYRTLRTLNTLRGAFRGADADFAMRPVPVTNLDLARWWTNRFGVNAVMNEWPRLLYYAARGRF